ncbi:homeobox protein prospero/prox-1/ceh-26,putative [Schistosoma mansoni]|uniref:homeobox protein prospero/prox-1/ceh-26,putative n=1 Tax=Schistosoma mansoni TaxID=6183 RepID=UPI0001A634CC|nr:homeobox protein prospero/prox-1/ceh-26,putative [Schistosoma mansoni]|eukprot:XP_018646037.1 homeobox protein prospero/prox-1/ceh-26,putative [Schistosoma mansoni]
MSKTSHKKKIKMESYSEDERNFQTPEYLKPRFNGLEGKYIHSTPLSQSNPYSVFHPISLGFTGCKDILTSEKTTPLYIPLSDEGYSSVGSSSTPTDFSNNLPTSEIINQYKDYRPIECIHNSINQREKLEIVALELLNQARLITNYSLRQEMIRLIDNSMHQLETYLHNHHLNDWYHSSMKSIQSNDIQDYNMTPLNLKFTKNIELENLHNNNKSNQNQSTEEQFVSTAVIVSSEQKSINSKCPITTSTESSNYSTRSKPLRYNNNNKTRRLRIHQFNSQLFVDRNQIKKINRLSPSCNKRQLNDDVEEPQNKIPHLDESLDLRIYQNDHKDNNNNKTEQIISLDNHSSHCSQTRLKRSIINSQTKTTTLSAAHLKKAKMMFMYSRYPTSSLLKSYFPEVCFNRGSTAQLVKWFSNFREFFYIQIEKFVRQQKATGLKKADDIRLSREHELIRSMETHFNKGDEIETPKEFLEAIQITVWEFADAILNERDVNSSWKKTIYKKISILDIQFPEFFRC